MWCGVEDYFPPCSSAHRLPFAFAYRAGQCHMLKSFCSVFQSLSRFLIPRFICLNHAQEQRPSRGRWRLWDNLITRPGKQTHLNQGFRLPRFLTLADAEPLSPFSAYWVTGLTVFQSPAERKLVCNGYAYIKKLKYAHIIWERHQRAPFYFRKGTICSFSAGRSRWLNFYFWRDSKTIDEVQRRGDVSRRVQTFLNNLSSGFRRPSVFGILPRAAADPVLQHLRTVQECPLKPRQRSTIKHYFKNV